MVLLFISCHSYGELNTSIDVGLSNYSFLTLGQDTSRNSIINGKVLVNREVKPIDVSHFLPSFGFSMNYHLNSQISMGLSGWYLGQPRLRVTNTYQTSVNRYETETANIKHHFTALSLIGSYRFTSIAPETYLNIGYGHFFERYDNYQGVNAEIVNGTIRNFDVYDYDFRNDEGHLTFGITTNVKWFNRSDLQFRWQHLQSMYGPVEVFTLGVEF